MLANYGYIGLFLIVAVLFACIMIVFPIILRLFKLVPKNPTPVKMANFECGLQTIGKTWVQFNFHFYFYALLFVALDVLVVFLYPWAVNLKKLGLFGLSGILILISIVIVGYIYAWRKNVLEWK